MPPDSNGGNLEAQIFLLVLDLFHFLYGEGNLSPRKGTGPSTRTWAQTPLTVDGTPLAHSPVPTDHYYSGVHPIRQGENPFQ